LKAVDTPSAGSTTDQLRRKYEETRDKIVAKVSKEFGDKVGELAKKGMDLAVEKGVPYVADQALKGAGVSPEVQGQMSKAVEDYLGQITSDKSGEGK
jgi:hypothetical protein